MENNPHIIPLVIQESAFGPRESHWLHNWVALRWVAGSWQFGGQEAFVFGLARFSVLRCLSNVSTLFLGSLRWE